MADIDRLIGFMAIMQVPFMNDPDALAYIEEVKTVLKQVKAQEPGWISVKDRLPERQNPVLVYVPPYSDEDEEYVGHVAVSYYTFSANGGYWAGTDGNVYGAIGIIHTPSHWMPLPEPPKEVNEIELEILHKVNIMVVQGWIIIVCLIALFIKE